jgi:hypothetical protein
MKNKTFSIILGIILFLPMVLVFFLDRIISVPVFWMSKETLVNFLESPSEMGSALIRSAVFIFGAWMVYFFFL